MAMHTELWFPQVIWSAVIHMVDNYELKNWAYERKMNDIGRRVTNFGGYQSDDIRKGANPQVDKLVDYLNQEVKNLTLQAIAKTVKNDFFFYFDINKFYSILFT